MEAIVLTVQTGAVEVVHDLTPECAGFVRGRGDGLLHVFVPHATAGVAILELGTWQRIAMVDLNVDNPRRQVRLSFLPG